MAPSAASIPRHGIAAADPVKETTVTGAAESLRIALRVTLLHAAATLAGD